MVWPRVHWLGTAGCLYMVVSLVGATTGQVPGVPGGGVSGTSGVSGYGTGADQQAAFPGGVPAESEGSAVLIPGQVPGGPAIASRRRGPSEVAGEAVSSMVAGEGFLGFAVADGQGGHRVILVHGERQWMAVYAIEADGTSRLLSSRPLGQDFEFEFNSTEPTPAAIKRLSQTP